MTITKRIAVVGIGGVGGYLAAMIGKVCPGLTLVARGSRLDDISKNGINLQSEYKGAAQLKARAVTADQMGKQDIVFICVKNYSLQEVCREISPFIDSETIVVPVMNGVEPGDKVREYLPKAKVIDALIYIVAFAGENGLVVQQGNFARMCIGIKKKYPFDREILGLVYFILSQSDIDASVSDDIEVEIWRKYILNCAYNVSTACYNYNIGQLKADLQKAQEYESLVYEAASVAVALGVAITQEHIDAIIHRFYYEQKDDATSSMQRDIVAGRPSELETFSGYIVREAKRLGLEVPVSNKMYELLRGVR